MQHINLRGCSWSAKKCLRGIELAGCPEFTTHQPLKFRGMSATESLRTLSTSCPGFAAHQPLRLHHDGTRKNQKKKKKPCCGGALLTMCSISCVACSCVFVFVLARHVASMSIRSSLSSVVSPSCVFVAARAPDSKVVLWLFSILAQAPLGVFLAGDVFPLRGLAP